MCADHDPMQPVGGSPLAPAAPISPQEIAEMRERWARVVGDVPVGALDKSDQGERLGSLIGSDMPRLLDAIEALTAERDRLRDALNTTALEACEAIDDRLQPEIERLTNAAYADSLEIARLREENASLRGEPDAEAYDFYRRRVEAAHAAAKADHPGIDMDLLGRLCREEPDADTKREVAEMMGKLNGGS